MNEVTIDFGPDLVGEMRRSFENAVTGKGGARLSAEEQCHENGEDYCMVLFHFTPISLLYI